MKKVLGCSKVQYMQLDKEHWLSVQEGETVISFHISDDNHCTVTVAGCVWQIIISQNGGHKRHKICLSPDLMQYMQKIRRTAATEIIISPTI